MILAIPSTLRFMIFLTTANLVTASPTPAFLDITTFNSTLGNSTTLGEPYECFGYGNYKARQAKFTDCARAAAFLPNLHTPGSFHRGDSEKDPFAVPRVETYGTCEVKIDVRFGRADESTWQSVSIAINKILVACAGGYGQGAMTGGKTSAGSEDRIVITVGNKNFKDGVGDDLSDDSTGDTSTAK